jgi:parallel beta-helix repeat protein
MKAHTLTPRSGMLTWLTRTVFRFLALASVALAPAMSLSCTNQKDVRAGLQDAVDRALPGGTIELGPGEITLPKRLVIKKSLTIRGAGPDKTRIISWEPDSAIAFVGDNEWRLEDLSVEHLGSEPANVIVVSGGTITIRNCHFSGAVWDKEANRGGSGIVFCRTAAGAVINCVCRNNGLHGIELREQAQKILLEDNICERNSHSGIAYFDSAGGTARNNTCRNNKGHGIQVSDQAQPTLEGNTCQGNEKCGIAYFDSAGGTARNNIYRYNLKYGIYTEPGARPILEGNREERLYEPPCNVPTRPLNR